MRKILLLLLFFTSCARTTYHRPISYRSPLLIVLDAGHGDHDPGATAGKIEEKDLALRTTLMTQRHLRKLGYRVLLTRYNDTFIPLNERAAMANRANATIFVSIHYNASDNAEARGVEIFAYEKKEARSATSERLAEAILAKVLRYTGAPSRGLKEDNFAVLRETDMPATLIEGGFVTNKKELECLKDPKYLHAISWGIAQGIHTFFLEEQCNKI